MKPKPLFASCLALSLAACAGTMTHMATYGGAARSFAKEGCGQFCWSRHRPASNDEISGASTCEDAAAEAPLKACAASLSAGGKTFVDKKAAQDELETCMASNGWWRITVFITICE